MIVVVVLCFSVFGDKSGVGARGGEARIRTEGTAGKKRTKKVKIRKEKIVKWIRKASIRFLLSFVLLHVEICLNVFKVTRRIKKVNVYIVFWAFVYITKRASGKSSHTKKKIFE